MPVGVMLASMTSLELAEWEAFFSLEKKRKPGNPGTGEDDGRPLTERIRDAFSRLPRKE